MSDYEEQHWKCVQMCMVDGLLNQTHEDSRKGNVE